jgi:hypothetical protein
VGGGPDGWDPLVSGTGQERWIGPADFDGPVGRIGPKEKRSQDVSLDRERYY